MAWGLNKPLGQKAYGSIPHLPGSRLGPGDHNCGVGQARIATEKARDKHDLIIVQEKLDGSNCCAAKIGGEIIALGRSGYRADDSQYPIHRVFAEYVKEHAERFGALLNEGERIVGEFLAQAVGTRYHLIHEPFVPFDIIQKNDRLPYIEFKARVSAFDFILPRIISIGGPLSVASMLEAIKTSGHGAIDEVEGAIWRVERKGLVDFLCKYVHHHKQDGKYFPENNGGRILWNCDVSRWLSLIPPMSPTSVS